MKIHARHILVQHRYEAEDILKKLRRGGRFEELARAFSTCSSGPHGGDLGLVDSRRFVSEFAEVALALKPGETSSVVRTQFGYHIILRVS